MSELPVRPMSLIPTEILIHIFSFTKPIPLVKCRQVCSRWKSVIDNLLYRDDIWQNYCKEDFNEIYKEAYNKSKCKLRWFDIYRTLYLWSRLDEAVESRDEFASASSSSEEIRDFQVLRNATIGVHCRTSINYYDLMTLQPFRNGRVSGQYLRYMENDSTLLILTNNLDLFIIRKHFKSSQVEPRVVFQSVKTFILRTEEVFFVNLNDTVYRCDLLAHNLDCVELTQMNCSIMCIGYSTQLNILTSHRDIYSLQGQVRKYQCTMGPSTNLLHTLRKYGLLENLDWRVYFQWMYLLNHSVPHGPLRDIIVIKTYGNIVFVGSNSGVFRIYYSPYVNEKFDIFNSRPIKQYNFMERSDCPVLSICPIIRIDVVESRDSHFIYIAMPKKIAVIRYTHDLYKHEFPIVMKRNSV